MNLRQLFALFIRLIIFTSFATSCFAQNSAKTPAEFRYNQQSDSLPDLGLIPQSFKGYTSHWTSSEWSWYTSNGFFTTSRLSPESEIKLNEIEIGNQLLLDELWIQDGFISRLAERNLSVLRSPEADALNNALLTSDILVSGLDREPLITGLLQQIPQELQFRRNRAFYLEKGKRKLFVIASHTEVELNRLIKHLMDAKNLVDTYKLSKGVAGIHSNYLLITPGIPHNPYDLINLAIQLGCSWAMVSGYNDWLIPGQTNPYLQKSDSPFIFMPGQYVTGGVMYGLKQYPNIQDNTLEQCLDWKEAEKGYYFSNLNNRTNGLSDRFDGYIVTSLSDQERIDSLNSPIISNAGTIGQTIPPAMILFHEKEAVLTKSNIWEAILKKKAVVVFEGGKLAGPKDLVDPLKILILEKQFLREQFVKPVDLQVSIKNDVLTVVIRNKISSALQGNLRIKAAEDIIITNGNPAQTIDLAPYELKELQINLAFNAAACGKDLPIAIFFETAGKSVQALAHIEIPFPIEMHPLIFDQPGPISYPVTVFNYSGQEPEVEIKVYSKSMNKILHQDRKHLPVRKWQKTITNFDFKLEAGDYSVYVSTLGLQKRSEIVIKQQRDPVQVFEQDLDGDGIHEIVMENSLIKATLLLFGGRVIEYIVKERDENLLFKLWPQKPPWAGTPRGIRAFYPWGGLEEFTGYPYIGGHTIFNYEILQGSGNTGRVRLWANIHGSKIEKIISLYGDSALLEVRYAMNDIVPSITVIGINPLIEIGPSTGPEDVYYFPADTIEERRPVLDRYYGDMFFLKEGWAAGYDTEMDISLIIGYPVNDAMFLHLWNNHPNNTPTPYYYTELQPWLKIKPETTTYFSYYLFGQSGNWQDALDNFRKLGIVTTTIEEE